MIHQLKILIVSIGILTVSSSIIYADVLTGLVGWWKFDEGSGTSAADSSGSGYTGTLINSPTWITGKKGGALTFNGSNNYVSLGTGTMGIAAGSTGLTLSSFVKMTTFQSYTCMIGKSEAGGPYGGWQINANADSGNKFGAGINVSGTWSGATSASTYSTGVWYHVAMTYNGTTIRLYVNGVQNASTTASGTIQYKNSAAQVYIGRNPATDVPVQYLTGSVDDVRIYNRALTATEIYDLFQLHSTMFNAVD